jgi:ABC-2 type transport system ATP-binding protein
MSQPVIVINNLTHRFGEHIAVDGLTLDVQRGEIFGFLGHNGAGKTTTIRLLNGLLFPSFGEMRVLGFDPRQDGPALRAHTGVLTETPSLDERLSAHDNLSIFADLYGVAKAEVSRRVEELLGEFELLDRAKEKVAGFSKGMKQRLAIARALLHRPELLYLDEPTAGLDPLAAQHVHNLVLRLARRDEVTVFLCTHNLAEAERLCDRVAVLDHGCLAALGTPRELTSQYVKQLDVEVEVGEEQVGDCLALLKKQAIQTRQEKDNLLVTLGGREQIPKLASQLTGSAIRLYRLAAHDTDLEEVYFSIHQGKENTK